MKGYLVCASSTAAASVIRPASKCAFASFHGPLHQTHAELADDAPGPARGRPGDLAHDGTQPRRERLRGRLRHAHRIGLDLRRDDAGDDDRVLDEPPDESADTGTGRLRGNLAEAGRLDGTGSAEPERALPERPRTEWCPSRPERAPVDPERTSLKPGRARTEPERVLPERARGEPERASLRPERAPVNLERAPPNPERVQTNPKRTSPEPERTLIELEPTAVNLERTPLKLEPISL